MANIKSNIRMENANVDDGDWGDVWLYANIKVHQ